MNMKRENLPQVFIFNNLTGRNKTKEIMTSEEEKGWERKMAKCQIETKACLLLLHAPKFYTSGTRESADSLCKEIKNKKWYQIYNIGHEYTHI